MIPVAKALQVVLDQTTSLPAESVALVDALGRILAEDIVADTDLPPFDRAQMDGYAIRTADVANTPAGLRIVGESAAGSGWHQEMKAGEAVRIMTGAPVPAGADAVQQVELTRESDDAQFVEILEPVDTGRSIVERASEIKMGEMVFERVALRPGKPTVFARLGDALVFGLPGNPVSVAVTFNLFARTALRAMQGANQAELIVESAVLARDLKGSVERESYLPAAL